MDTEFQEKTEELLREAKKADEQDRKLVDSMEALMKDQHFGAYIHQVLSPRIDNFGQLLLEPSGSHDGMVKSEFLKGALYGLCLARDLPSVILSATRIQETSDE